MHSRRHARESLCELTCLCRSSDYMSVYLSVCNTYIYSIYRGLKQLTMAQIICSFTVFFQRFYAACFPLHRILCATTRSLTTTLSRSFSLLNSSVGKYNCQQTHAHTLQTFPHSVVLCRQNVLPSAKMTINCVSAAPQSVNTRYHIPCILYA